MEQSIFKSYPEEQRKQMLEDNAAQITKGKYHRAFGIDEKNQRRQRVCEIEITLQELDEETAEFKASMKLRREPLIDEKKQLLADIKSNGEYVEGNLYKIIDRDKREVGFYNEDGELVEQRRMTKEDNQLDISDVFKVASNL